MNHRTLPSNYRYFTTLDFTRNRRQIMAVLKLAVALTVVPLVIGAAVTVMRPEVLGFVKDWRLWVAMFAMLVAYIPLHELTHGEARAVGGEAHLRAEAPLRLRREHGVV